MGRAAGLTFDLHLGDLMLVPSRKASWSSVTRAAFFSLPPCWPPAPQAVFRCSPETMPQWRRRLLSVAAERVSLVF